jgi:hypothetical protein
MFSSIFLYGRTGQGSRYVSAGHLTIKSLVRIEDCITRSCWSFIFTLCLRLAPFGPFSFLRFVTTCQLLLRHRCLTSERLRFLVYFKRWLTRRLVTIELGTGQKHWVTLHRVNVFLRVVRMMIHKRISSHGSINLGASVQTIAQMTFTGTWAAGVRFLTILLHRSTIWPVNRTWMTSYASVKRLSTRQRGLVITTTYYNDLIIIALILLLFWNILLVLQKLFECQFFLVSCRTLSLRSMTTPESTSSSTCPFRVGPLQNAFKSRLLHLFLVVI